MSDKDIQDVPAVGFMIMAFTDEKAADQALEAMKKAKKEKTFYFENAAIIRQDSHGKVHYHETGDMKTGRGAGVGALIGGIVGILAAREALLSALAPALQLAVLLHIEMPVSGMRA